MHDRPLRVRHLLKGLGPGGAERLVVNQVATTGRTGDGPPVHYDVVYLLAHKNHLAGELARLGVETRCLDSRGTWRPGWVWRLRRMLVEDPVDIVHAHSPVVAAATRVVVRSLPRRRRPVVVGTEHNRWPRHRRPTRWANRATIGWQDVTIAVSGDVRATMARRAAGRARVVVHGIDLEGVRATADRAGARAELGVSEDEILVVCVANLRREKALEVLVSAATQALDRDPRLRYALVGQGPLAEELAADVAAHGVGARFALLGYRADATRIVSGADVFTLSSRHEGLPVAVMEALALGIPVVATAAGGVPDAVDGAGVIVAVDDDSALAAAHLALASDESRRLELARAASEQSERFSAPRATAAIEAIYRAALTRANGERAPSSQS